MSASATPYSPSDAADPAALRHSYGGWAGAVGIILLFALALVAFPPLANAGREVAAPQWALFLGRFHPIAVHLPVGVLILAAVMDALTLRGGELGNAFKPAVTFAMGFGAFGAVVAVIFGVLLSREGGYDSATFQGHQMLGIATAVLAIAAYVSKLFADSSGKLPHLHRLLMLPTLGVMSVGAHLGGNMVHGSNYLLEHTPEGVQKNIKWAEGLLLAQFGAPENDAHGQDSPSGEAQPTQPAALGGDPQSATVYAAIVAPLMESKCNSCHGAEKSKGGLRLDTHAAILKGGDTEDHVVPGHPEKSLFVGRMLIPADNDPDEEHMPPAEKPQPTKEEIALLGWWVKQGASKDVTVAQANFPAELKPTVTALLSQGKGGSGGSVAPVLLASAEAAAAVDPAVATAMKKINGSGASLSPLAASAKELRFTALNVAKDFTDANLKDLEPVVPYIVALDLAKTKITDAACDLIAKMTALKELHLENTAISDAGVAKLQGLSNLEYLNLYGSKVTDKTFAAVAGMPKLKALYLWQTGVTRVAAEAFKAKHPATTVNTGWTEADNAKIVAAPAPAPAAAAAPAPTAPPIPAAAKPAESKPATGGTALPKAGDANAKVFADIVAPILAAKCTSCHGMEKSKGKLRLHTFADTIKGGSDGATTVIAGDTKKSLLVVRAKLPVDDDDHMPPSDEPQLTKEELALLEWWIAEGAKEDLTIGAAKKTPEIESYLKALTTAQGTAAPEKKVEKPKAKPLTEAERKTVAEVTAKMAALNATLMPLALDTEQLRFSCVNAADKFGDKDIQLLAPAAPHIVWLDLGRTKITDTALATVAKMPKLERLHLENTGVTDAGLAQLTKLTELEYLNL
ncbi:MAG: c-type cytochrome domain-containing protein, partial [Roseimicrobium sp.]